jgi:hypothetical protein
VKQVYMEDNGEQKEKYYCKTCYRNTSMENNGSKENREKGITDKAGTVDGIPDERVAPNRDTTVTNSIEQCNLGINPGLQCHNITRDRNR